MSSPETEVLARIGALLAEHDPTTTSEVEFLGAQYDAGLAWVHFEKGFGGLGLGPALQEVIDAALRDAGAPSGADRNPVGYGHGAGSVYTHGTDEQRRRWLSLKTFLSIVASMRSETCVCGQSIAPW